MPSKRVVIVVDPVPRSFDQIFETRPWASVDQFLLVGREEGFGDGVVETDPGPPQRAANAVALAVSVELSGCVLGAAVGMEDHSNGRPTVRDRHVQRVGDQAGAHVIGDRPADNRTRVQVDHGGQVGPAVPSSDVGDVAAPLLVRRLGGELPAEQVWSVHRPASGDRGPLPGLGVSSPQPSGPHKPPDPLEAQSVADRRELGAHPSHAGVAARVSVQPAHDRNQLGVCLRPPRKAGRAPVVIAGRGHAQFPAHERHRVFVGISPVCDSSELHCFPFANQVATFFANSTCICNSAYFALASFNSPRSRISSSRSDSFNGASAGTEDACASRSFFTHLPNVISCTPILRATSATGRPPSITKATASALYSSVKLRRVDPTIHTPLTKGSYSECPENRGRSTTGRPAARWVWAVDAGSRRALIGAWPRL